MEQVEVNEARVKTRGRGAEQRRLEKRFLKKQSVELAQRRDAHLAELQASLGSAARGSASVAEEFRGAESNAATITAETLASQIAVDQAHQDSSEMLQLTQEHHNDCMRLKKEARAAKTESGALHELLQDKLEEHMELQVAMSDKESQCEHIQLSMSLYESLAVSCDRSYKGVRDSIEEVQIELLAAELRTADLKMASESNRERIAAINLEAREAQ